MCNGVKVFKMEGAEVENGKSESMMIEPKSLTPETSGMLPEVTMAHGFLRSIKS